MLTAELILIGVAIFFLLWRVIYLRDAIRRERFDRRLWVDRSYRQQAILLKRGRIYHLDRKKHLPIPLK